MILCLDVGNSQIFGGVFDKDKVKLKFRHNIISGVSSDQLGLFLKMVLKENGIDPSEIEAISLCSVVPSIIHSLKNACSKYFNLTPFILGPGVRTGLKIKYKNPAEVGADRIANAIAAYDMYPDKDVLIVDFGTATTICLVTKDKTYQGGVILAGLNLSMKGLEEKTAKLKSVEILKPESTLGTTTTASIQSGLYYGHFFAIKGIIDKIKKEHIGEERESLVIGTGGFSSLFEGEDLFSSVDSDLVLRGLLKSYKINKEEKSCK